MTPEVLAEQAVQKRVDGVGAEPEPEDKERAVVKEHGGSVVSEILDHVDDMHGQPAYAEGDRDGKDDLRHLPPLSESQQAHLLRLRPRSTTLPQVQADPEVAEAQDEKREEVEGHKGDGCVQSAGRGPGLSPVAQQYLLELEDLDDVKEKEARHGQQEGQDPDGDDHQHGFALRSVNRGHSAVDVGQKQKTVR